MSQDTSAPKLRERVWIEVRDHTTDPPAIIEERAYENGVLVASRHPCRCGCGRLAPDGRPDLAHASEAPPETPASGLAAVPPAGVETAGPTDEPTDEPHGPR